MSFHMQDASAIVSPALLIDLDAVDRNIDLVLELAGTADRVWPHVKTHKSADLTSVLMRRGFRRFKCSTIAEAEMLGSVGADAVLVAYQMVGPNPGRLARLAARYLDTRFATIVDDPAPIAVLSDAAATAGVSFDVLLDVDIGMHRTGIAPSAGAALYAAIAAADGLKPAGLHGYDGHNHQPPRSERDRATAVCMSTIRGLKSEIEAAGHEVPRMVMGGTPTFPCYAEFADAELSPGTCFLNDWRCSNTFRDLPFVHAAFLLTRVLSASTPGLVTFDCGNKAIASDPVGERGRFLELDGAQTLIHNEEHWLLSVPEGTALRIGDERYVVPTHVCPSVAVHRSVYAVRGGEFIGTWDVTARDRALTV